MIWYHRKHYSGLRLLLDDGARLPPTYEEWYIEAEVRESILQARGTRVVRVYIEPLEFTEWCTSQGYNLDANARDNYVEWVAGNSTWGRG